MVFALLAARLAFAMPRDLQANSIFASRRFVADRGTSQHAACAPGRLDGPGVGGLGGERFPRYGRGNRQPVTSSRCRSSA